MSDETRPKRQRSLKKGGGVIPALCSIMGTVILLSVILTVLPVTVPRFMGYEIYGVVSGSMEPELPVRSIVYVEAAEAREIAEGEIIAFTDGDTVVTHRVVKNRVVEGEFVTKGDANSDNDPETVEYTRLIGRVKWHFPVLGGLLTLYTSTIGKVYALMFAACGAMLNMLASKLRESRRDDQI